MNTMIDISIVIVSWNVKEKLKECLRSVEETVGLSRNYRHPERLPAQAGSEEPALSLPKGSRATQESRDSSPTAQNDKLLDYEVFVVDNASKDGTVEMVEQEFPWVHVIANDFNAGFAKANNQAIRLSQGRYVLLLNPDMRLFQGTLEGMVKFMEEPRNSKVGVAGCWLISPFRHSERNEESRDSRDGRDPSTPLRFAQDDYATVAHVRRFPRLADQLAIMLKFPHLFPRVLDQYMMHDFDYSKEARVDSIRGSFFMIRREVMDKIGMLDELFFFWFEEVDFCKRTWETGYEVAYTPSVKCIDYVGQSIKQVKFYKKQEMFTRSMVSYFQKHRPWWEYRLLWTLRPVTLVFAWIHDQIVAVKK